jgi:hypothetical protein
MTILVAQVYTGRKGVAELCTLVEEGGLVCKNVILYGRPKAAVAIVKFDLDDIELEEVELEEYEGVQMFIGDADTFNAKMLNLALQGYFVSLHVLDIGRKDRLITATYTVEIRKSGLPDECSCNGDEEQPCEACKRAAEMPPQEDELDTDKLEDLADEECPVCGGNPENLCETCVAARAGVPVEEALPADEQPAAPEEPGGETSPDVTAEEAPVAEAAADAESEAPAAEAEAEGTDDAEAADEAEAEPEAESEAPADAEAAAPAAEAAPEGEAPAAEGTDESAQDSGGIAPEK